MWRWLIGIANNIGPPKKAQTYWKSRIIIMVCFMVLMVVDYLFNPLIVPCATGFAQCSIWSHVGLLIANDKVSISEDTELIHLPAFWSLNYKFFCWLTGDGYFFAIDTTVLPVILKHYTGCYKHAYKGIIKLRGIKLTRYICNINPSKLIVFSL